MAKRKRTVARRSRRRVGAVGIGSQLPVFAGVAVGAIAARLVGGKLLANLDPKISSAVQVAAGVILSTQKMPLIKGVGLGMLGAGVVSAGQSFGLIAGVNRSSWMQPVNADEMPVISGYQGLNYLGNPQGSPELSVVSGIGNPQGDAQLSVIAGDDNFCS